MDNIILYLLTIIQEQYKTICWLLNFICRYIPLKQWAFDDSHSPKYQKFTTDRLPVIKPFIKQDWRFLLEYYLWKYGKPVRPVQRRNAKSIPEDALCPLCGAPHHYLYDNNGGNGQYQCKVCGQTFVTGEVVTSPVRFVCPYCGHSLVPKKDRKFFRLHKCVNPKCSFYLHNLSRVEKEHLDEDYGKNKYKLHYLYREFTVDFFRMDLDSLPKNASSLKFSKHNAHIMSLCLTMHVNLQLSLRKTAQALYDLYGIKISHQQVANYARTAAIVIKPFVDHYDYPKSSVFTADETYIKVRGIKGYIWFITDAASRSIFGYQVSDNRSVGPCILAMRMAFRGMKSLPEKFRFIADGYSAYPLAALQFVRELGEGFKFDITQVIGLTNDDAVSKMSPEGIGGDDRAGVYMILQIIREHRCHVLFCEDEEIGGKGAREFANSRTRPEINYIVEMDRRGANDAVFYSCDNPEFTDFVCGFGFEEANGSFSDISVIAPRLGIAAVNISAGYYNEHRRHESIDLAAVEHNIARVSEMIRTPTPPFEYIERCHYVSNWHQMALEDLDLFGHIGSGMAKEETRKLMPLPNSTVLKHGGQLLDSCGWHMLDAGGNVYHYISDLDAAVLSENCKAVSGDGQPLAYKAGQAQTVIVLPMETALEKLGIK